ncbi:GNAT family N-acetyltransferase [Rufibacter latericius]|uniref:GNAT family N-acetyltransferase n=1 Tax=Rufibacter latericius TaxID=2487040 RepID=A0A3M9MZY3_9BACT|nr:GNAT family N-acetyltransferase [Rufibacter latericius]RNI31036.1 GNAT family N-acetyltransferase [Rufibacter latericius]
MNSHLSSSEPWTIQPTTNATIIRELAHATWNPTYGSILSQEQIDFMLTEIYSLESLQKQMEDGQTFLLYTQAGTPAAFAAYSLLDSIEQRYKLNKLYIHPSFQGQGAGKRLLEEVIQRTKALGGRKLELNVHRQNPAQHFYLKNGFKISKIIDLPFAQFMLNDYIMELNLSETS